MQFSQQKGRQLAFAREGMTRLSMVRSQGEVLVPFVLFEWLYRELGSQVHLLFAWGLLMLLRELQKEPKKNIDDEDGHTCERRAVM